MELPLTNWSDDAQRRRKRREETRNWILSDHGGGGCIDILFYTLGSTLVSVGWCADEWGWLTNMALQLQSI